MQFESLFIYCSRCETKLEPRLCFGTFLASNFKLRMHICKAFRILRLECGNLCGYAAKYLAPCRFWYKEAEGGRRVRLRLVREFATRMRQRGVRVGSDKCFTFVRRVTQDTACGGMRTPSLRLGGFVIPVRAKKEHTIWCALFLVTRTGIEPMLQP